MNKQEKLLKEQEKALKQMEKYNVRTTARKMSKTKTFMRLLIIILLIILLLMSIAFACVKYANQAGRFTVNLDPEALSKYGISLSESPDFTKPAIMLSGTAVEDMNNITEENLPADINEHDGSHNGDADGDGRLDYVAYSFYIKNTGKEDVKYYASIDILSQELGADEAIRVKVYKDGVSTTYGKTPKPGTEKDQYAMFGIEKTFTTETKVMEVVNDNFKTGDVTKYTVVIWLEGWDPECVDDILGGEVKLSMNFHIIDTEAGNEELV